jgi:PBSX family phage terminase large subunit
MINLKFNPKQEIVFQDLFKNEHDEILLDGGSRSGKTFLLCFLVDYWSRLFNNLITIENNNKSMGLRGLICRSKLIDVKATILEQTFIPLLEKYFYGYWSRHTIEGSIIVYQVFNSEIWISGLDNPRRSDKVLGSEYNWIYTNELLDIAPLIREKLRSRLARKTEGFRNCLLGDCNPGNPQHYIYKRFYNRTNEHGKKLPDNLKLFKANFIPEDNQENLAEGYIERNLDSMSGSSKERFRYGRWANIEGAVHPKNIKAENIIECNKDLLYYDDVITGMDFGHYSCFIVIGIKEGKAYIIYNYRVLGGMTKDIIQGLKEIPYLNKYFIYADHENDRIIEIANEGFLIKPAYKEVGAGDSSVNGFEIYFDNDCMDTYNCMLNMRKQQDKDGNFIDKHVKEDDHEDDAVRYAIHGYCIDNNFKHVQNKPGKTNVFTGNVFDYPM